MKLLVYEFTDLHLVLLQKNACTVFDIDKYLSILNTFMVCKLVTVFLNYFSEYFKYFFQQVFILVF